MVRSYAPLELLVVHLIGPIIFSLFIVPREQIAISYHKCCGLAEGWSLHARFECVRYMVKFGSIAADLMRMRNAFPVAKEQHVRVLLCRIGALQIQLSSDNKFHCVPPQSADASFNTQQDLMRDNWNSEFEVLRLRLWTTLVYETPKFTDTL